jgi:hypothetical protein
MLPLRVQLFLELFDSLLPLRLLVLCRWRRGAWSRWTRFLNKLSYLFSWARLRPREIPNREMSTSGGG